MSIHHSNNKIYSSIYSFIPLISLPPRSLAYPFHRLSLASIFSSTFLSTFSSTSLHQITPHLLTSSRPHPLASCTFQSLPPLPILLQNNRTLPDVQQDLSNISPPNWPLLFKYKKGSFPSQHHFQISSFIFTRSIPLQSNRISCSF